MCFVDSSTADSVDMSGAAMSGYECNACGNKFRVWAPNCPVQPPVH